jgi:hypothetical protein
MIFGDGLKNRISGQSPDHRVFKFDHLADMLITPDAAIKGIRGEEINAPAPHTHLCGLLRRNLSGSIHRHATGRAAVAVRPEEVFRAARVSQRNFTCPLPAWPGDPAHNMNIILNRNKVKRYFWPLAVYSTCHPRGRRPRNAGEEPGDPQ